MVKNIIFDLGVVLLNVDYSKTINAFGQLGLENPDQAFSKAKQDDFFRDYEKGNLSDTDFLKGLSQRMNHDSLVDIEQAWCAMLGDFPKQKFDLLKRLSSDYRLFILSNTNSLHRKHFERTIDRDYGWKEFSSLFEYIGYSHVLRKRKPEPEAFLTLLENHKPEIPNTLFIDDTLEHVEAARRVGLTAIHFNESKNLEDELEPFLIISS